MTPGELRFLRKSMRWSTREAAIHYGCSRPTLVRYESGRRQIPSLVADLARDLLLIHDLREVARLYEVHPRDTLVTIVLLVTASDLFGVEERRARLMAAILTALVSNAQHPLQVAEHRLTRTTILRRIHEAAEGVVRGEPSMVRLKPKESVV